MALIDAFERRSHPSNPEQWLINGYGGRAVASGARVNEDTALSATAIWAGVRVISETLAMLPFKLMERIDERHKQPARALTLYRLLHSSPNPEQTSFEFREMQQGFLLTWGNCYAQKIYNGRGEVTELWPLVPWRVTPERTRANGLAYRVTLPDNGGTTVLSSDDVLHIKGFSSTGLIGDNVIQRFREAIGLSLAAEEFAARFFGNGLNAGGVFEHPGKLGTEANKHLRASINERQGGLSNSHRFMILEEGMKWQQITVDPEKAQALEMRKFQVTEASRILRLPPHLLYDLERSTNNNIEWQGQEFVTYSLQPWFTRWEQRVDLSCLLPSQRSRYFTQFEVKGLLRGDTAARTAFYKQMFDVGAYSPNDILEHEDEQPVEGGDQRFVQLNLVPLDKVAELVVAQMEAKKPQPPEPPKPPKDDTSPAESAPEPRSIRPDPYAALEPVVRAEFDRIVRRQVKAVRGAMKKPAQEFRIWADGFFEKETALVVESLTPALLTLRALTGETVDAQGFAALDTTKALTEIRAALAMPEHMDTRVGAVLTTWESQRVTSLTNQIMQRQAA